MRNPRTKITPTHWTVLPSDYRKLAESAQKEGSSSSNQKGSSMGSKRSRSRVDSPDKKVAERFFQFQLDILWEILLRLPIEAILLCRCVCKAWYDVVKNLNFISKQMKISSNQPPRIICNNVLRFPVRTLQSSSLVSADGPRRLLLLDIEDGKVRKMPRYEHSGGRIIFSHNGLLCLVDRVNQSTFSIRNPITSESIELLCGGNLNDGDYCQVGFCYVPTRQTYVVVHASITNTDKYGRVTRFYIKTSGQRAWRMLKHPECITLDHKIEETVYWNDTFFWKVKKGHNRMSACDKCILSFDTVHEKFQIISYPDDIVHDHYIRLDHLKLLVLNGRLTLIERGANNMKLWQVIGDKVGEFSLVCRESYDNINTAAYTLVSRGSDNENLLTFRYFSHEQGPIFKDFVVAGNDMRPYKTLEIDGLPIHFKAITFNPSLFSPHSMGII